MSKKSITPVPEFEDLLPREYQELVHDGPYAGDKSVADLGRFKELTEAHPHCAGCGVSLAVRLATASLPAPADTAIVGTPGCSFFALVQTAVNYSNTAFGNQNAVASGLKRMLSLRFPDTPKDVVVMVGDGGVVDIGLDYTLHSWFRGEKITTVMLDNEVYANTGGQESGMSGKGSVLNMAPKGKAFHRIPIFEMARQAGCVYAARVTVASPRRLGDCVRKAVLIAREAGPTFVQVFTPCPTNLKFPNDQTIRVAKAAEKGHYAFEEFVSEEARACLEGLEAARKGGAA